MKKWTKARRAAQSALVKAAIARKREERTREPLAGEPIVSAEYFRGFKAGIETALDAMARHR